MDLIKVFIKAVSEEDFVNCFIIMHAMSFTSSFFSYKHNSNLLLLNVFLFIRQGRENERDGGAELILFKYFYNMVNYVKTSIEYFCSWLPVYIIAPDWIH